MQVTSTTPIAFVDLETTGVSPTRSRVLEVGIVRVDPDGSVSQFQTLLCPDMPVGHAVTVITGITDIMVEDSPRFEEVATQILEMLDGALFVAHNVRFDFAFLSEEFKRLGIQLKNPYACSARLSQALFPREKRHNLDSVMERHGLSCTARHRALPDAQVVSDFFSAARTQVGDSAFYAALNEQVRVRRLPPSMPEKELEKLPHAPGVYLFYAADGSLLYVGKSRRIKTRVRAHFTQDAETGAGQEMLRAIARIEYIATAGEIGALLLESHLIKTREPVYNRMSRKKQTLCLAKEYLTPEGYCAITVTHANVSDTEDVLSHIVGVFKNKRMATQKLRDIASAHALCPRLLWFEHTSPCFAYSLGQCKGACIGAEKSRHHNKRFREAFEQTRLKEWPFEGPVVLEETWGNMKDAFVVDHWKVTAALRIEGADVSELLPSQTHFEYDTYTILAATILKRKLKEGIALRPVVAHELSTLSDEGPFIQ
jgi:DNA polymerase-3 subunit epsilon